MKGFWRAAEVWHYEWTWKAIGEGAVSVAIDDPGLEGVTQRSWDLAPWREPMWGYGWSLVTGEDSNFGDASSMTDHQEQQQQWSTGIWSLEDKVCATKGRAGEVTQALGGAQKVVSGSQTLDRWSLILLLIVTVPWHFPLSEEGFFSGAHSQETFNCKDFEF
jgi:hypothetical protein